MKRLMGHQLSRFVVHVQTCHTMTDDFVRVARYVASEEYEAPRYPFIFLLLECATSAVWYSRDVLCLSFGHAAVILLPLSSATCHIP